MAEHSRVRIAFYGGTDLSKSLAAFVEILGEVVLDAGDAVLVTGGFLRSASAPDGLSADHAAVAGAQRYLARNQLSVSTFIETWLPDSELDRRREGVERFEAGTVRTLRGRSAQARRFTLVEEVDALITFKGKKNTAMVLDLALAIGRPALPLPFTGGDSADYWRDNRAQVQKWFGVDDTFADVLERIDLERLSSDEQWSLARQLRDALRRGVVRRCLVLMPYHAQPELTYAHVLQPTIEEAGFVPVRIDRTPDGGPIYESFLHHLDTCECVVADVTQMNPNVMYELGHVHARGLHPFLFCTRTPGTNAEAALPFYLRPHRVTEYDPASTADVLSANLGAFLRALPRMR